MNATAEISQCNPGAGMRGTPGCVGEESIPCVWGAWSSWETCSKDCAGGQTTRTRSKGVERRGDGDPCQGDSKETAPCNQQPCENTERCIDCALSQWAPWSACSHCGGTRTRS